jgi:hypothetical protein
VFNNINSTNRFNSKRTTDRPFSPFINKKETKCWWIFGCCIRSKSTNLSLTSQGIDCDLNGRHITSWENLYASPFRSAVFLPKLLHLNEIKFSIWPFQRPKLTSYNLWLVVELSKKEFLKLNDSSLSSPLCQKKVVFTATAVKKIQLF